MELTAEQLERLFRNFEKVDTVVDRLGALEKHYREQQEQHEENVARLEGISDRITANTQEDRANQQRVLSTMREVQAATKEIQKTSRDFQKEIGGRVARLETPVRQALAKRNARRKLWLRFWGIVSAAGAFLWLTLEPARQVIIEHVIGNWLPPTK